MNGVPTYSIVIPTYRRGDMLAKCLESVCALDYALDALEVLIVDNAGEANSSAVVAPFNGRIRIRYLVNRRNQGYGYSVNRGIVESSGERILLLNDDAMPQPDLLAESDRLLASEPAIGAVGCRAIENGYQTLSDQIGEIGPRGEVHGNFNLDCGAPIDVDHVYGFCYVFTRRAVELAGLNDRTLLARRYSSGNRIETDHCLMIKRAGLRVVYNPRMVAVHLAKPRSDMSEVSLAWTRNAIRNTLYLYLKHYGLFGKKAAALRLTFLAHVGVLTMLRNPSGESVAYFVNGLRSRASAYAHYLLYLSGWVSDRPERLRELLNVNERVFERGEETGEGEGAPV
jgi:GT2 family glycosyltransferase